MKLAVIGLGSMGALHLQSLKQVPEFEVVAVCSRDPRKLAGDLSEVGGNLKQSSGKFDFTGIDAYPDWRELMGRPDLDAVDICLPSELHLPVTLAALAAGKHVLCEKPMALTGEDCDAMIDAARRHSRVLMIAHVLRFWPDYDYLARFVKEYRIRSAAFRRQCGAPEWSPWLADPARSGGPLVDLLIHDIDQVIRLFGIPKKVSAQATGSVDTVDATLFYDNLDVRIQGGWLEPGAEFSMGFHVESDRANLDFEGGELRLSAANGEQVISMSDQPDAYVAELRYFAQCCQANQAPGRCLPQDSANALKLALLLKKSREQNGAALPCHL